MIIKKTYINLTMYSLFYEMNGSSLGMCISSRENKLLYGDRGYTCIMWITECWPEC